MDFSISVVTDFAVIMIVAGVVTVLFHRLNQPLILGYLIAGIIIGPYTPPFAFVNRLDVLGAAADLGVILLLFTVGLQFPLEKFRKSLRAYASIAAIEVVVMFLISFAVGWGLRWSFMDSLFLGAALASSSTVIIAKVLGDMGKLQDISAQVMLGVLVVEDVIVVVSLAAISSVADINSSGLAGLTWAAGKVLLFFAGSFVIGLLFIPRLIDVVAHENHVGSHEHDEVIIVVALGLSFGLAVLGDFLGLSLAVGAFLAGLFAAGSRQTDRVASLTSSIKTMFAALFFVSMGAFIDVRGQKHLMSVAPPPRRDAQHP
ncbi:MAG: cation:proton antiporter [Chloroflexi bacterium]|nr:cation:proton antiporter [Chloroflexota bacterium]